MDQGMMVENVSIDQVSAKQKHHPATQALLDAVYHKNAITKRQKRKSFKFQEYIKIWQPMVLNDFNLSIYEGQRVAVTGPSGSGKSTLARIILWCRTLEKGQLNGW